MAVVVLACRGRRRVGGEGRDGEGDSARRKRSGGGIVIKSYCNP